MFIPVNIPEADVLIRVPPQEPVYNSHWAPVPKEPPLTVKSTGPGLHRLEEEDVNDDGSVDGTSRVTVVEAQAVVLQFPEARAK